MNKTARDKKQSGFVSVLKGLGISYVITCAVFALCALMLTYTDMSMGIVPVVSIICTAVSCAAGGLFAATGMENKGLVRGMAAGALYAAILIAINIMAGSESAGIIGKAATAVCALASGGIGGIIGVNRK